MSWVPRLQILAAALLFSTGGVAVKSCSLGEWQIASLRSGVAVVVLLAFLPAARRDWSWRHGVAGIAYAGTMVCFVLANKATTATNAIFLQATAPLYVFFLAPWLLGERNRRRDLGLMALMALGLLLLVTSRVEVTSVAPNPARGNLFGAIAGVSWALTLLALRWLGRLGGAALPAVVAGNAFAFLGCLPGVFPLVASATDWGWVLYLGIFQIGLAYILLTRALETVPAFEAALLLLAEPVFNPIWAYLGHGERPGQGALAGALLICAVTLAKPWLDQRVERRPESDR